MKYNFARYKCAGWPLLPAMALHLPPLMPSSTSTGRSTSAAGLVMDIAVGWAKALTMEQGKPLAESAGEIVYGASFVEWFAEEAKRVYGDVIPNTIPGRRLLVLKQPIGVVCALHQSRANFPHP